MWKHKLKGRSDGLKVAVTVNLISSVHLGDLAPAGYYVALRVGFHFPTEELNGLPDAWVREYTRQRFMIFDPINHWVYASTGAIRWSEITLPDPRGVLKAATRHGLKYGIAVSHFDREAGGQRSFGHFCRSDREFTDAEIAHLRAELELRHTRLAPPANLTAAELEVLRLAKDGLRQKQIAHTLGVSEGAIKQRLKNAREKLGAATATQATSIATAFGLI